MLWSFIAVFFSGWLYVDAAYRGPAWQRWAFKPITLILLLFLAWQAPMFNAISYLVLAGLCASLLGDALTLLPRQRMLYAIGALFLSHLLYTIWFAGQLAVIWTRLEEMRLPVLAFIGMTLMMVWVAGELWFMRPTDTALSGFFGAGLLLLGNIIWLVSKYRCRFRADTAIYAACYFAGHFFIVRALYL